MLQSTLNIIKERKKFTEDELKSMSYEEINKLNADIIDSVDYLIKEHLINDEELSYCEDLMMDLETEMSDRCWDRIIEKRNKKEK